MAETEVCHTCGRAWPIRTSTHENAEVDVVIVQGLGSNNPTVVRGSDLVRHHPTVRPILYHLWPIATSAKGNALVAPCYTVLR